MIPALGRQRQAASLIYRMSSRIARATQITPVSKKNMCACMGERERQRQRQKERGRGKDCSTAVSLYQQKNGGGGWL